jgi:hypothetical protein
MYVCFELSVGKRRLPKLRICTTMVKERLSLTMVVSAYTHSYIASAYIVLHTTVLGIAIPGQFSNPEILGLGKLRPG